MSRGGLQVHFVAELFTESMAITFCYESNWLPEAWGALFLLRMGVCLALGPVFPLKSESCGDGRCFGPFHPGIDGKGQRPRGWSAAWQIGQEIFSWVTPVPCRCDV